VKVVPQRSAALRYRRWQRRALLLSYWGMSCALHWTSRLSAATAAARPDGSRPAVSGQGAAVKVVAQAGAYPALPP